MQLRELLKKPRQRLWGSEKLTEDESDMILDLEEEQARCGRYERIFPIESSMESYSKFFEFTRYENTLLMLYLRSPQEVKERLLREYPRFE